ncbi:MAG: hypothetical protein ABR929_02165 [Roseiarcus sp.]|jgi:hypothetical protein
MTDTSTRKAVEFYTIELAQLDGGGFHISLTATTVDEEEPQLLLQEIACERVASLEDALAVIKNGVDRNQVQFPELPAALRTLT